MSDTSADVTGRLKCAVFGHSYRPDRAEDREEDGYTRHHRDGTKEPIPACYIVEKCLRCHAERRIYASVDTANRFGVPKGWERPADTDTDQQ